LCVEGIEVVSVLGLRYTKSGTTSYLPLEGRNRKEGETLVRRQEVKKPH